MPPIARKICKICFAKHYGKDLCRKHYMAAYHRANRESIGARHKLYFQVKSKEYKEYQRLYRESNKDRSRLYRATNSERLKAGMKAYYAAHKYLYRAARAKRRSAKLRATPPWLTKVHLTQIAEIYRKCPAGHHVDHIIPLQGKNVSGLHVPWNLQFLPAKQNKAKGNKI